MPRKSTKRAKKGSVSVIERRGMLSLRWRFGGQRHSIALGLPDTPANHSAALGRAAEIEADIRLDRFDSTLEKYRPSNTAKPTRSRQSTPQLFEQFIQHRRANGTSGQSIASRYTPLLSHLKRFKRSIVSEADAREFITTIRARQSSQIANQTLSLLKGFGDWAVKSKYWTQSHFKDIPRLKAARVINPKRTALTRDEVAAFLTEIKQSKHRHYHDYCLALFSLGARPSEVSGLRWRDIDWPHQRVIIAASLSRASDGRSAGYARERKGTKNEKVRFVDLSERMVQMLRDRQSPESKPNDLIFTTPRGKPIDDHNFSQRVWRPVCRAIGIDKVPYAARHTLGSHLLHEGAPITSVAAILGNNPETVSRHYAHELNRPPMPEF